MTNEVDHIHQVMGEREVGLPGIPVVIPHIVFRIIPGGMGIDWLSV